MIANIYKSQSQEGIEIEARLPGNELECSASLFLDTHCCGKMWLELVEVTGNYKFSGSSNTLKCFHVRCASSARVSN